MTKKRTAIVNVGKTRDGQYFVGYKTGGTGQVDRGARTFRTKAAALKRAKQLRDNFVKNDVEVRVVRRKSAR